MKRYDERTIDENATLFERWRSGYGHTAERRESFLMAAFLCLHQLRKHQVPGRWGRVSSALETYRTTGKLHIAHSLEKDYEFLLDLVLSFLDLLKANKHRSVLWCIVAFKRRFTEVAAYVDFKRRGVGVSSPRCTEVTDYVEFKKLSREVGGGFEEVFCEWKSRHPNKGVKATEAWLYRAVKAEMFDNPVLSLDYLLEVGVPV